LNFFLLFLWKFDLILFFVLFCFFWNSEIWVLFYYVFVWKFGCFRNCTGSAYNWSLNQSSRQNPKVFFLFFYNQIVVVLSVCLDWHIWVYLLS
jgi:hypothetical protein